MPPDDEIPEHDHLADATRRALGQLADTSAADSLSWGAVQSRARRVKAMRTTTAIAACVIVLAGLGALIGTVNRNQDHVNVAGPSDVSTTTSEPAPTTSSSTPATTVPRTPVTCEPVPCGTGIVGPPATTPTAPPASAAPEAPDFKGSMALNERHVTTWSMYVGDDVDIAATIQNITDHEIWPSDSRVPTSVATVCTSEPSGRRFLWWMTNLPMAPGERSGRSGTFTPTDLDVGTVNCYVVIVSTKMVGTVFDTDAGGDDATTTVFATVTGVAPVTITVGARTDTSTTLPTDTTVPDTTTTTTP